MLKISSFGLIFWTHSCKYLPAHILTYAYDNVKYMVYEIITPYSMSYFGIVIIHWSDRMRECCNTIMIRYVCIFHK